ncbi:hypothetical protein SAMN05421812_104326 [Asanoa hainanensis]|uniref:Uncharacterized protein n=1 Tax=Asanoa hainanensis TaxID=560556 RepID=A0A239LJH3_9ACTN|nr:hypothetical protein [Asanoa hainanensis]SNT29714.1 hypothetical protein SAMN05421812_104326 [Asanoa hainanensis]
MTLAVKGSRRITVDGVSYRWLVRGRPTYCQGLGWTPLTFVVGHAERTGAVLVASMPCAHPSNWIGLPSQPVLPGTVASCVRRAVTDGWQPGQPGPPFEVRVGDR